MILGWAPAAERNVTAISNVTGPPKTAPVIPAVQQKWEILDPINKTEVETALIQLRSSAVGVDKLSADDLFKWDCASMAGVMDLLLVMEILPGGLSNARVTLIPKTEAPKAPSDFRPIAITPIFTRAIHKILAGRLREQLQFSPLQHAFLKRDGCLEASMLLHVILRQVHDTATPAAAAFLDLSKAFDTISHEAILQVAAEAGIPGPLLRYLEGVYGSAKTTVGTLTVKLGRGVRQGDPLSPLLFILAMERAVKASLPGVGFPLGDTVIGSIAYVDDLILLAPCPSCLQRKLDGLIQELERM